MAKGLLNAGKEKEKAAPKEEKKSKGTALGKEEEVDLDLVVSASRVLMKSPEAQKALVSAANAADPAQGIAQFIVMLMPKIAKKLDEKGMTISPNVFLAKDGYVDQIFETIQAIVSQSGVEIPFSLGDQVEMEVMELAKAAAMAEQNGQQQAAQAPPQGGLLGQPPGGDPTAQAGPMPPMNGGMM